MADSWFGSLLAALSLNAGYNAALVAIGAGLLGFASGASGAFLLMRKRALVADSLAHATLPGVCIGFMVMVAVGLDGRALAGLLIASVCSAALGLITLEALTRYTRLPEDAAIGAVLSVFFGLGVVLLTVIQNMNAGRQAGLETFLLGSAAGMLFEDALIVAGAGIVIVAVLWALRRPMVMVSFDPSYAATLGLNLRLIDFTMMFLVMVVTVVGLKIVGLVLSVALLIIPPASARFWTDQSGRMILISAIIGGASCYIGAAISATAPALPSGPIIVLVAASCFVVSFFGAPRRGILYRRRAPPLIRKG